MGLLLLFAGPWLGGAEGGDSGSSAGQEKRPPSAQPLHKKPPQTKPPPARTSSGGADSPITVLAQTWDKTKDRIFAQGDVEVRYQDLKLFADQVEVNTETKTSAPWATSSSSRPIR
jgi:lipopolysaccharide assembly outer membrane protein LptD (OstA)